MIKMKRKVDTDCLLFRTAGHFFCHARHNLIDRLVDRLIVSFFVLTSTDISHEVELTVFVYIFSYVSLIYKVNV